VDVDFLPFLDSASTVADDVGRLRASGLFGAEVSIWGGLYCVDSHRTTVLVPPASAGPGLGRATESIGIVERSPW
jgi:hypothetical protein